MKTLPSYFENSGILDHILLVALSLLPDSPNLIIIKDPRNLGAAMPCKNNYSTLSEGNRVDSEPGIPM